MALDVYKEWLGIPDDQRPPDHYALLRIPQFTDDAEKIRKNYKKLNAHVRKYASGQYSNESQKLLNELAKAMLCLTDSEQKNDYDRSLGRVIDDRDEATGRRPLTAFLQDEGLLNSEQIREAKQHAERAGLTLRDALVQLEMVSADDAACALAMELGRPYVDLSEMLPDDEILDLVPKNVVRRFTCLPLFEDRDAILVACSEEPEHELEDEIRIRCERPMRAVIAPPLAIKQAIAKYYANRKENTATGRPKPVGKSSGSTSGNSAPRGPIEYSADEKAERKQLGIVICCLTFVILSSLDTWVFWPNIYKFYKIPDWFPFISTIFLGGPTVFAIYNSHIKAK